MTVNYRDSLRTLADLPGFWIGGHTPRFAEIMGASVFCIVPKGVGTWTHRLYEALLAGCIPVVLSDDFVLPFPELPWSEFSVRWPMGEVDNVTFPGHLRRLYDSGKAFAMKKSVDKHSCWFDYHSVASECSPLSGITRQLRELRPPRRRSAG